MEGGGAERQLVQLAAAHVRAGLEIHVALLRRGINYAHLQGSRATVHVLPLRDNRDPRIAADIVRIVRTVRPHVLQTWLPQMDVLGGTAALLTGTPWVLSERSSEGAYRHRFEDRVVRRWLATGAGAIVSNSQDGAAYWARRVPARVRRAVVRNALSIHDIAAAGPPRWGDLGFSQNPYVALFAGRLAPEKNLDVLLEALRIVFAASDAVAVLCGEGPLRTEIELRVRALGIEDRIRVLGYRTDIWSMMKGAAVFVSPSLFEGQPNAVLEAMACGCPLVVSDIATHREFLDENTAALVPPNSVPTLAAALLDVLRNPAVARGRAAAAQRVAESFSIETAAERYENVYRELIPGNV